MITSLKTALQFALSATSQLQNEQDNQTMDAEAWDDLADDFEKLVEYARQRGIDSDEVAANARLMTAAPELYDELLEAEHVLSALAGVGVPNALVRIRALLARIEGGTK